MHAKDQAIKSYSALLAVKPWQALALKASPVLGLGQIKLYAYKVLPRLMQFTY